MPGLPISNVVSVTLNLSQIAAAVRNFGALCIAGPTDVISVAERIREYSDLPSVGADFGTTSPEYLCATDFFSQSPKPAILYIARWVQTASSARLTGGVIAPANQAARITALAATTTGSFAITLDGVIKNVTALTFAGLTTLDQVAAAVSTGLAGAGTCVWDGTNNQFVFRSSSTGITSTITYLSPAPSGTDISTLLSGTQAAGGQVSQGIAAETPLACEQALADFSQDWYGLIFAPVAPGDITDVEHLAVAAAIEATVPARIYGVNTMEAGSLNPIIEGMTTDLAYLLSTSTLQRTCCQYSSNDPFAVASLFGRGFTVDFTANNSTITLNGKVEPGVTPETLTLGQANALKARKCNVFVNYSGAAALIQYGTMANGFYFDEVQGADWMANQVQTDLFNKIINAATKIPQTDAGVQDLLTTASASCQKAFNNGLLGPGIWQGPPVGSLATGDMLPNGYYIYAPPIASQATADRQARIAPTMQIACYFAGAIHSANVLINVQR